MEEGGRTHTDVKTQVSEFEGVAFSRTFWTVCVVCFSTGLSSQPKKVHLFWTSLSILFI